MSSAPGDAETYKPLVVKGVRVGKPSELKLKVDVRRDEAHGRDLCDLSDGSGLNFGWSGEAKEFHL